MISINKATIYRVLFATLFIFLCVVPDIATAQLSGYTNRLKGQVNSSQVSGTSDLSNFPVLVSFALNDLRTTGNGGFVQDGQGDDITFTAANGTTILSHQRESYDAASGAIEFWVRFPTLSGTVDTEFYIYFGNPSITSDQSSTNVWDANYKMVLHLNNDVLDASGEGTDGVSTGGTADVAGQIGRARFYGANEDDQIVIEDNGVSPLDISGNITISFWMYGTNFGQLPDIVTKGTWNDGYGIWPTGDNGALVFQINNDDLRTGNSTVFEDQWQYVTVTRASNGDRFIYVDGVEEADDNSTASFTVSDDDLFLSSTQYDYEGGLDEVRISNNTRSGDWVATEYNNQSSPVTFFAQLNAEPILDDIEAGTITYNSGDSPTIITSSLTVADGDDTNIESATVAITSNFNSSQDVLSFADQNGITGSYASGTGILTLSGTSSEANYQTALRSITYENTNPVPTENTRTISFTINDGDDDSNTETRNISVVKVNIAPVLSGIESSSIIYFAGTGTTVVTSTISASDLDNVNIESATIEITGNYLDTEDELAFANQNGITGTWTVGTGVLELTGSATKATYKAALRTVTYENTAGSPDMTTRTISITINDGTENSNTVTRNVEYPTDITELASYKAVGVFHFDSQDADGDGDSGTNQPANGTLTTWGDRSDDVGASAANIVATAIGGDTPTLSSTYFGGRSGIFFDYNSGNAGDTYPLNDNAILNTSNFSEKSFAAIFRTGSSVSGLQIIYEQGGGTRGYQISVKNGEAFAFAWSDGGWLNGNYQSINLGAVEVNTSYILIMSHDATNATTGSFEASLNGGAITASSGEAGIVNSHGGDANIGEEDGTRDPVTFANNPATTNSFDGFVGELVSWNTALTTTDFTNIYGFLSEKWFNTPSVLSGIEISNLSYGEGDAATDITDNIIVTDEDDTNLDSAKVYISSGFESSEDVLAYSTALGITGSYNSSLGILTLTGTTTVANYQTALRNVTYQNTEGTSPSTTIREVSFIVYDWDDSSGVVTREIYIIPSNDVPTLAALEGSTIAFTEDDAPTQTTAAITVADIDDANLQGATVSFINNYFLGEDELDYVDANGITGSFNSSTGILSLSGTTSLANYQTALRAVTYENISSDPVTGMGTDRTIEFRLFDGIDSSATGTTRLISVTGLNTAPTLSAIESSSIFYLVGDSSVISETITITDPDDTNIETVTFQITGNYTISEDSLVFQDVFGITDSWADGTGILTLTGPATKADFQSAIRTVRYRTKENVTSPTDTERTVSITANDGEANSNIPTRTVSFSIPKSIDDLLVWLKGDAGTFTTTGGSTGSIEGSDVGRWEDQSGNTRHFTATNGGNEPTFRTGVGTINSQSAIEYDGTSGMRLEDIDAEGYLNGLDELTIFFVIESDVIDTDHGFWTTTVPSGTDNVFTIRYDNVGDNGGGDNVIKTGMRDLSTAFAQESFEDAQTTAGQIVMLKWTSEENYELYVDGVLSNPTFLQNIPTGALTGVTTAIIGQGEQDASSSWEGLIAEVILYGAEIALSDQEDVEDYLSTKYGIAIRSLTAATGGEAISADDASIAPSPAFTTLSGPRVQESFAGEFSNGGTFVFNAPTGFQWDTGSTPTVTSEAAFGGTTLLDAGFTSITSTQITFTISAVSTTNPGELTFGNLRVQPTTGTLPNTGNITNTGTTGLGGSTSYGTLTMVSGTQIEMEFSEQPSTSNVSSAISPVVRVQLIDQFGNAVEESRVVIDVDLNQVSGSGVLGGTTSEQTNIFGIAEFDDLTVDDTGTYSLTASAISAGLADTTSNEFDVVVLGELTQFLVERSPSGNIADKLAGQSFNINIIAVDGTLDTVDTFTGTITLSSNCTIGTGGGTSVSFTAGVLSSKTVSISSLGTCTLTATNSAGAESGTSNSFDVTPGAASTATTLISASPSVILNDGFSTSTITVQLKDSEGNNRTVGGETIALSATDGTLGSITDNGNGTYTATLTSSVVAGTATITGTLNAVAITDNALVEFAAFNNLWRSSVGSVSAARNWDLATNWSSGSVPLPGDKVLIPANPAVGNEQPVINTTNTTITQLSIESGASVTVSGGKELIVTGELSGDGEILGSNTDSVTVGGNLDISDVSVGYVKLDGSTNQDVTSPNGYVNLELDNSNGADFFADLSVSDSLKLTSGTLFMPSGTNLIANAKEYGTGNIRMQRRMYGVQGWRIISSPIDTTFTEFLDGVLTQGYSGAFYDISTSPGDTLQPNVLTYLEDFDGTDNQRYRSPDSYSDGTLASNGKVPAGKGIFLYSFGNIAADSRYNDPLPDTLDVIGQEFEGDKTEVDFEITYTTSADSGWNLIGNPFLATIDWDDTPNWTKTNVESTIYIWDPASNGGDGEYLTWNGVTGTLPNGGLIAPFQGFWVKANDEDPELKVNLEAKTTSGSFLRKAAGKEPSADSTKKIISRTAPEPRIGLYVESDLDRSKRTNIMFSDIGTIGKDVLDAYRLLPLSSSHIEFHTLLNDGTELAINNLPLDFNSRQFIPLHIDAFENGFPTSGELTMIWDDLRTIPEDWILTLVDNDTGKEVNMMDELSYTFNHSTNAKIKTGSTSNPLTPNYSIRQKAKTQATRFTLKISTEQIERDVPEEIFLSQNYPNPFNPSTLIPFGLHEDSNVELIVYDILGRKVRTLVSGPRTAGRYEIRFTSQELASGVYFYRLVTNSKVLVKKLTLIK